MDIYGLQKLTLLDYPGRVACTLFTGGCDFRCPFCHNALLVTDLDKAEPFSEADVMDFLARRRGVLDGVCVTGGEPLLQPDLADFLAQVKALGYLVKLDTNGSHPNRLKPLLRSGLVDYVAMDVKNDLAHYAETVGRPLLDLTSIQESIRLIRECGLEHEFRTTLVRGFHTPERLANIGRMLEGESRYFLQAFVDSGHLIDPSQKGCSKQEMVDMLAAVRVYIPQAELRGVDI